MRGDRLSSPSLLHSFQEHDGPLRLLVHWTPVTSDRHHCMPKGTSRLAPNRETRRASCVCDRLQRHRRQLPQRHTQQGQTHTQREKLTGGAHTRRRGGPHREIERRGDVRGGGAAGWLGGGAQLEVRRLDLSVRLSVCLSGWLVGLPACLSVAPPPPSPPRAPPSLPSAPPLCLLDGDVAEGLTRASPNLSRLGSLVSQRRHLLPEHAHRRVDMGPSN